MDNKVPALDLHLSPFNLTHTKEGSHKLGYLYPVMFLECVPNDRFQISHSSFSRFSPLVYPIESKIGAKFYDFWVPQRILFKYWKQFIADSKLDDHLDKYSTPKIRICDLVQPFIETVVIDDNTLVGYKASTYFGPGSLLDWLGFPMAQFFSGATFMDDNQNVYYINDGIRLSTITEEIEIMPLLAYQFIRNRWFRDENLEDDLFSEDETIGYKYDETDDVINLRTDFINYKGLIEPSVSNHQDAAFKQLALLRPKLWERDYFTSALPTPQYGEPVPVPISSDVKYKPGTDETDGTKVIVTGTGLPPSMPIDQFPYTFDKLQIERDGTITGYYEDSEGNPYTAAVSFDSSSVTTLGNLNFTINDLRQASAVQRYQETLMRIGHRYDEYILGVFNQVVPDSYLDEPLLLNTHSQPVVITDIAQTTPSTTSPLGSLAGNAYSKTDTETLYYHCEEFGYIITIATMLPRTQYMNGLPKFFSRKNRLDYYNPLFQEIGDQAILNKELYLSTPNNNDNVFGYIPRYNDYKQTFNTVHGDYTGNMSFMSLGRNFANRPYLNKSFLEVDQTTVNRAFAETSDIDHVYSVFRNEVLAVRPMMENPLPKLV